MTTKENEYYEILVRGQLDHYWSAWFEGLTVTALGNGNTLITGPIQHQAKVLTKSRVKTFCALRALAAGLRLSRTEWIFL